MESFIADDSKKLKYPECLPRFRAALFPPLRLKELQMAAEAENEEGNKGTDFG